MRTITVQRTTGITAEINPEQIMYFQPFTSTNKEEHEDALANSVIYFTNSHRIHVTESTYQLKQLIEAHRKLQKV